GMRHRLDRKAEGRQVLRQELIQSLVIVDDEDSRAHSRRSACIGGISDAFRAGNVPKLRPTVIAIPSETRSASHGTPTFQAVLNATTLEPLTPNTNPPIHPASANSVASNRNCIRMSRGCAPTAIRRPISRDRSLTDISIRARMPVPPTTTAIAPTAVVRRPRVLTVSC